jgi:hypothetical protein
MKQEISETDWVNSITGASDIHGAVSDDENNISNICRNISHKMYVQINHTYNIAILVESSF